MTDESGNTADRKTMSTLVGPSHFPTTRWTLVVAAADPQRKDARSALVSLCESYWYPLYAYIRRRGYPEGAGSNRGERLVEESRVVMEVGTPAEWAHVRHRA